MLVGLLFACACLLWIATCDTSGSTSGSLIILSASVTGSITGSSEASVPTGSYESYSSTVTASTTSGELGLGSITNVGTPMATGNVSSSPTTTNIISSSSQLLLLGSVTTALNGTDSLNATATSTSTSAQPTNTTPCNNYLEFCLRQYSNITEVSAHNSPL
jgi:hypothetical protein